MKKCVMIFCLLGVLSINLFATSYYVSTSGNDSNDGTSASTAWRTLAKACSTVSANQGHIINLGTGTFTETSIITIPSGTNIVGSGMGNTILTSTVYYTAPLPIWECHHDKFFLQMPNCENQTLSDFTIDGADHKIHGAIYAPRAKKVRFTNLAIQHFNWSGLYVAYTTDVEVDNCEFVDNALPNTSTESSGSNIMYFSDTRLSIHDCDITQCQPTGRDGSYGIKDWSPEANQSNFYNVPGGKLIEMKIWNCNIKVSSMGAWNNWSSPAITLEVVWNNSQNCEIRNCNLNNNISIVQGRYGNSGQSWRIHHNIFDMWDIAYAVELCNDYVEVDHNYIRGGVYPFAQWHEARRNHDISIHHNTILYDVNITNPFSTGIYRTLGGADRLSIYNNTLVFTNKAFQLLNIEKSSIKWKDLMVKNNIFLNQTTGNVKFTDDTYTGVIDNNVFVNVTPIGTNAFTDLPGLTLSGDKPFPYFTANSGASFVVDKGVDVGFPFTGVMPDIGACEYGAAQWELGTYESLITTVTARGENSAEEGIDKLTDTLLTTKWVDNSNTSWIQFEYSSKRTWNKYIVTSAIDNPSSDPKNWTLSGSNDGTTWTALDTQTNQTWTNRSQSITYLFANGKAYSYYKWEITANQGAESIQVGELTFSTCTTPSVSTTPVTNITSTSANSGGNVSNDGGEEVTARGICWSTALAPTISDNKTTDNSGMGTFTSQLTTLTAGITYHVRAYATNSLGTSYGNDVEFIANDFLQKVMNLANFENGTKDITDVVTNNDNYKAAWYSVVDNPLKEGVNTSNKVLEFNRPSGEWKGVRFMFEDGLMSDQVDSISFDIFLSAKTTHLFWTLKKPLDNGNDDIVTCEAGWLAPEEAKGKWYTVTFPVSSPTTVKVLNLQIFPNPTNAAWLNPSIDLSADTYYIDNVTIYKQTITSINQAQIDENRLKIYPNPSNGLINIELKESKKAKVSVYDINGRLVFSKKMTSNMEQIDLTGYSGMFLIKVDSNEFVSTRHVVVK